MPRLRYPDEFPDPEITRAAREVVVALADGINTLDSADTIVNIGQTLGETYRVFIEAATPKTGANDGAG